MCQSNNQAFHESFGLQGIIRSLLELVFLMAITVQVVKMAKFPGANGPSEVGVKW